MNSEELQALSSDCILNDGESELYCYQFLSLTRSDCILNDGESEYDTESLGL